MYDGQPLSNPLWYIESGILVNGDAIEVVMRKSITNPGNVPNEIGVTITDIEGNNVTTNYKINYKLGNLTVKRRDLVVNTDSTYKEFDGEVLTNEGFYVQSGTLLENHRLEYVMNSSILYPGSVGESS